MNYKECAFSEDANPRRLFLHFDVKNFLLISKFYMMIKLDESKIITG